jgi:hypothetical protein
MTIQLDLPIIEKEHEAENVNEGSFLDVSRTIFTIAQFFGIMPVPVASKNPKDLKFTWKSTRFFCFIYVLLLVSSQNFLLLLWTFDRHKDIGIDRFSTIYYYGGNLLTLIFFVKVAKRWPRIMVCNLSSDSNYIIKKIH